MTQLDVKRPLAALAIALFLAGCGGNDDDTPAPAPTTEVPASATQSVSGLVAYMNQLIANMTNDTSEPVLVGTAVLPVDDTTELN